MKYLEYRRGLALGIIIILIVTTFGVSNVPGISERIEKEQLQPSGHAPFSLFSTITSKISGI